MTKESPSGEPEQIGEAMSFTAPEDKVCALCKWADRKRTMLVKEAEGSDGYLNYCACTYTKVSTSSHDTFGDDAGFMETC